MALQRVTMLKAYRDVQVGADAEFADNDGEDISDELIRQGIAKRAKVQRVYGHEDDMPEKVRLAGHEALDAANLAAPFTNQKARAEATAPWRK